jgi:hypothetical protein
MKLSRVVADSLSGFQAGHIFSLFAKVNCPDNRAITSHQGFSQFVAWEPLGPTRTALVTPTRYKNNRKRTVLELLSATFVSGE